MLIKIKKFNLIISQIWHNCLHECNENITSFTFANCFFNKLKNCHKINIEDLKNCINLEELLKSKNKDNKK